MENIYCFKVKIDDEKLKEIFTRLGKAQEEILQCYYELKALNVVVPTKLNATIEKDYSTKESKSV